MVDITLKAFNLCIGWFFSQSRTRNFYLLSAAHFTPEDAFFQPYSIENGKIFSPSSATVAFQIRRQSIYQENETRIWESRDQGTEQETSTRSLPPQNCGTPLLKYNLTLFKP